MLNATDIQIVAKIASSSLSDPKNDLLELTQETKENWQRQYYKNTLLSAGLQFPGTQVHAFEYNSQWNDSGSYSSYCTETVYYKHFHRTSYHLTLSRLNTDLALVGAKPRFSYRAAYK